MNAYRVSAESGSWPRWSASSAGRSAECGKAVPAIPPPRCGARVRPAGAPPSSALSRAGVPAGEARWGESVPVVSAAACPMWRVRGTSTTASSATWASRVRWPHCGRLAQWIWSSPLSAGAATIPGRTAATRSRSTSAATAIRSSTRAGMAAGVGSERRRTSSASTVTRLRRMLRCWPVSSAGSGQSTSSATMRTSPTRPVARRRLSAG